MKTEKDILKEMEYTDLILSVIDNQNEITRSDLQGIIQGIVMRIIDNTRKEQI